MLYRKKHIKTKIKKIRRGKPFFKKRIFWLSVLILLVAVSFFYFFVFYQKFHIKNIVISGNEKVKTEALKDSVKIDIDTKIFNIAGWQLNSKNIFLADTEKISQDLLQKFPQIENVTIKRNLPETLTLEIKERKPVAAFCYMKEPFQKCFFIDANGIIFEEISTAPENIKIIRKLGDLKEVFVGEQVVQKNIIEAILKIENKLKNDFKVDIEEALVTSPVRLDIKTAEKWKIYFDLESDIDLQLAKLGALLGKEIPENVRKALQYIDLRFENRAYYK